MNHLLVFNFVKIRFGRNIGQATKMTNSEAPSINDWGCPESIKVSCRVHALPFSFPSLVMDVSYERVW